MELNPDRSGINLLGPLLADFQLLGDGVDRLVATLTTRPTTSPA